MKRFFGFAFLLLISSALLSACGGDHMPLPIQSAQDGTGPGSTDTGGEPVPGFEPTIRGIFQQRCSACHNGAGLPDWTDYGTASRNGENIVGRITLPSDHPRAMPPSNSTGMTNEERELVIAWVEGGTPRNEVVPTGSDMGDGPTPDEVPETADETDSGSDESPEPTPDSETPTQPDTPETPVEMPEGEIFFEPTARSIFDQRCSLCHNGTALRSWTNYQNAFSARDEIARRITLPDGHSQKMPPGNATGMTDEERRIIVEWVEQGAPLREEAPVNESEPDDEPDGMPPPAEEPPVSEPEVPEAVTFQVLVDEIFSQSCMPCHSATGRAGGLALVPDSSFSSEFVLDNILGEDRNGRPHTGADLDDLLVRPGAPDPEDSFLIAKVIEDPAIRTAKGKPTRMPIGHPPLTDGEIEMIQDWIRSL